MQALACDGSCFRTLIVRNDSRVHLHADRLRDAGSAAATSAERTPAPCAAPQCNARAAVGRRCGRQAEQRPDAARLAARAVFLFVAQRYFAYSAAWVASFRSPHPRLLFFEALEGNNKRENACAHVPWSELLTHGCCSAHHMQPNERTSMLKSLWVYRCPGCRTHLRFFLP